MDALASELASFLDEESVITTSTACVSGLRTLLSVRDQALALGILRHLAILEELDQALQEADEELTRYWWEHVAADWDLSD